MSIIKYPRKEEIQDPAPTTTKDGDVTLFLHCVAGDEGANSMAQVYSFITKCWDSASKILIAIRVGKDANCPEAQYFKSVEAADPGKIFIILIMDSSHYRTIPYTEALIREANLVEFQLTPTRIFRNPESGELSILS